MEVQESTVDVSKMQGNKIHLITPAGQEEQYKPEALAVSDQKDQSGFDGKSN